MSGAYKCDRCGNLYEHYEGIESKIGGCKFNGVDLRNQPIYSYDNWYDLCLDCMQKLINFLNMR